MSVRSYLSFRLRDCVQLSSADHRLDKEPPRELLKSVRFGQLVFKKRVHTNCKISYRCYSLGIVLDFVFIFL